MLATHTPEEAEHGRFASLTHHGATLHAHPRDGVERGLVHVDDNILVSSEEFVIGMHGGFVGILGRWSYVRHSELRSV